MALAYWSSYNFHQQDDQSDLRKPDRELWCAVIHNAIEDSKGRKLNMIRTKGYVLRVATEVQREAVRFLDSGDLDIICDLFLPGISADTIRRGLK